MKNNMENRNLYLFLSQGKNDNYYCRSFFPEEKKESNVLHLPNKEVKKSKCDCCNSEYEGVGSYIFQMWCCPTCAGEWAPYDSNHIYNC